MLTVYDETEVEGDVSRAGIAYIITKPLFLSTIAEGFSALEGTAGPGRSALSIRYSISRDSKIFCWRRITKKLILRLHVNCFAATGAVTATALEWGRSGFAFEKSSPGDFALILMDVQMPVMDGYEATRRIRGLNREDAKSIPIFAMTCQCFAEDEEKSRLAGMDSHITKPLDVKKYFIHKLICFDKTQ